MMICNCSLAGTRYCYSCSIWNEYYPFYRPYNNKIFNEPIPDPKIKEENIKKLEEFLKKRDVKKRIIKEYDKDGKLIKEIEEEI